MEQPEGFTEYIKCLMQKQAKTQFSLQRRGHGIHTRVKEV